MDQLPWRAAGGAPSTGNILTSQNNEDLIGEGASVQGPDQDEIQLTA